MNKLQIEMSKNYGLNRLNRSLNTDLAAKAADYYEGICEIRNEVAKSKTRITL